MTTDLHDPLTRETRITFWYHGPKQDAAETEEDFLARLEAYEQERRHAKSDTISRPGVKSLYINGNIFVDIDDQTIHVRPVNGQVEHIRMGEHSGVTIALDQRCARFAREEREGYARGRAGGHEPSENPPPSAEEKLREEIAARDRIIASLLQSYDLLMGTDSPVNEITKNVIQGFFVGTVATKRRKPPG